MTSSKFFSDGRRESPERHNKQPQWSREGLCAPAPSRTAALDPLTNRVYLMCYEVTVHHGLHLATPSDRWTELSANT